MGDGSVYIDNDIDQRLGFRLWLKSRLWLWLWLRHGWQVSDASLGQAPGKVAQFISAAGAGHWFVGVGVPVTQPCHDADHARPETPGNQSGDQCQ